MRTPSLLDDPEAAWSPHRPSPSEPWDEASVAHLHRRAGLGATWGQVVRDKAEGFEPSIRRLLDGESHGPDGRTAEDFAEIVAAMEESARRRPSIGRVQYLWLYRMIFTPHPLAERMTLAWHGHFATSQQKVADPVAMLDQNLAQRHLWRAPFGRLVARMLDDRALLAWLDGFDSRRVRPNENLARELLELFALGEGNYSEADIKGVARALTGRRLIRTGDYGGDIQPDPSEHDAGPETFLGRTGSFGSEDVARIVVARPAAAVHVARRLYRTFVSDVDEPSKALLEPLAAAIRTKDDVDVARGIETVVRSRLFHSSWCRGRRVKGPVDYVVGAVRAAEAIEPPPDLVDLEIGLGKMGQRLFFPPNVSGWPGGLAWLRGPAMLARANFAAGFLNDEPGEARLRALADRRGLDRPEAWASAVETLLCGAPCQASDHSLKTHGAILRDLLNRPEAQLS